MMAPQTAKKILNRIQTNLIVKKMTTKQAQKKNQKERRAKVMKSRILRKYRTM